MTIQANLAIQQAKLGRAQGELQAAMDLLQKKEEEVRVCQEEYDTAMGLKQVFFSNNFLNDSVIR